MTVLCLPSEKYLPSVQSGQSGQQNKYRETSVLEFGHDSQSVR